LTVQSGADIVEGETFKIGDGDRLVTYEFSSDATLGSDTLPDGTVVPRQRVAYTVSMTAGQVATAVKNAINDRTVTSKIPTGYGVQAFASGTDGRVELFYAANVVESPSVASDQHNNADGGTAVFDLFVNPGLFIQDGQTFQISSARGTVTFEFDDSGSPSASDHQRIIFDNSFDTSAMAQAVVDAINDHRLGSKVPVDFPVRASTDGSECS